MKGIAGIAGLMLIAGQVNAAALNNFSDQRTSDSSVYYVQAVKHEGTEDDPLKSKSFTKSFPLSSADKVNISNQYGTILIKTWDKREIKVDIDIKAYSNNDSEAQKLLDDVSIDASKRGDVVAFKTQISDGERSWGSWIRNGKKTRREVKVNYTVYMPSGNALTLAQEYGNIDMGDQNGPFSVKLAYGNFTAGNLSSTNNYISVAYGKTNVAEVNKATVKHQYGSGLNIGTATDLSLDAQYVQVNITTIKGDAVIKQQYGSGLTIGSVGTLNLDAQYTKVKIQNIRKGTALIKQQYGNLDIGSAAGLNLKAQYTGVSIGTLSGDALLNMEYDKLNILKVNEGVRSLNIHGQYAGITLGFSDKYDGELEIRTSYASFKYGEGVTARSVGDNDDSSSDKNYVGKVGRGGSSRIKIRSEYGNVVFR